MKRVAILRRTPMKKSKPKARPGQDKAMLNACRGESCYLAIPGVCHGDVATVVPAHRNEGKGMGLKVADVFTVPGCFHCHAEYDSGKIFSREEKRAIWNAAYAVWQPVREQKFNAMVAASTATKTNARVIGASTPRRAYGNQGQ